MESETLERPKRRFRKDKPPAQDTFLLIRWLILIAVSFAMLGYGRLLPTLFADIFWNLEAYGKFLARFAVLSMFFLQVVYVFGVKPEISGREKGPKGDTIYLLCYIVLTLLPLATTLLFGLLKPMLIFLSAHLSTFTILYLVALLPAIILLEILVYWRVRKR